jgi:hypothetical protein
MIGEDVLFTVIDLAIALIGFSSIVTALRRSKEKPWSSQEINGLVFLALMAIGAIVFSLLPFSLFYMELGEYQIYSISAAIYCVFGISVSLGLYIRGKQSGFPSRRPRVFNFFAVLSVGVTVMMGYIATGNISDGVFGFYLFGVIWLLISAFIQFIVFLSFVGFIQEEHKPKSNSDKSV